MAASAVSAGSTTEAPSQRCNDFHSFWVYIYIQLQNRCFMVSGSFAQSEHRGLSANPNLYSEFCIEIL